MNLNQVLYENTMLSLPASESKLLQNKHKGWRLIIYFKEFEGKELNFI